MAAGENRRLLRGSLGDTYEITRGTSRESLPDGVDLCIVDRPNYLAHARLLARRKRQAEPAFLPVLLVTTEQDRLRTDPAVWETVDDLVETPIGRAELAARIDNLIQRRRTTSRLVEREQRLADAVSELALKERTMDAAPVGVTIIDPHEPDNPTIYANAAFERITGYDREEVLGRNMRFLQGPETDPEAVAVLQEAVEEERAAAVTLINYDRGGGRFWNRVEVAPVYDDADDLIAFVGFQTDVTDAKVREQRLSVLNRVMRHNLSNDLNVIEGYATNLEDALDDPGALEAVDQILRSAEKLERLGRTANWIERVLGRCRASDAPVDVGRSLYRIAEATEDANPEVDLSVSVRGGPWYVAGDCIDDALGELVRNAVVHNPSSDPRVSIVVETAPDHPDRVRISVEDDGPGIADNVVNVLGPGVETQLHHGDGLGLWMVYWVVTLVGGSIEVSSPDGDGGTCIALTLPVSEGPAA